MPTATREVRHLAQFDPDFTFGPFYIPGRPRAKGSQIRKGRFLGERDTVLQWMAIASAHLILERRRRESLGMSYSFPYAGNLRLDAVFIFDRPKVTPLTSPTAKNSYGDLDKLLRAVCDALAPGTFVYGHQTVAKAAVIADDSLITSISARKAFCEEMGEGWQQGAYIRLDAV
jgi:hypothetical protein